MTTLSEISKKIGVSPATVSCVLNQRHEKVGISEATQRLVLETAREMGYQPHRSARALATGRTFLVALWMPHLLSAYYARVAHLIGTQLGATPYDLLIAHTGNTPPSQVDGVLALVDSPNSIELSVKAHRRLKSRGGLPALCLMGCNMGDYLVQEGDAVNVNLENATHQAVRHLLENGCCRIAFLSGDSPDHRTEARYVAFTDAMRKAQRQPEYIRIPAPASSTEPRAAARAAVREYSSRNGLPDGIICLNDELAIGAHRGLRERGARVPDDVAIIGCDGIEDTQYVAPTLSTLVQPVETMCERAWELLQRRIEEPSSEPQHVPLQAGLVIRESSMRF